MDAADHPGRTAGTASIRRVPAKPRDRAEGARRPSSPAGRRRNPRAGSLPRTAGAVRVPPDPKGPRPSCRARRPAAMGRRVLQREAADARAHKERQETRDRRAYPEAQRPSAPRRGRVRARTGPRLQVARSSTSESIEGRSFGSPNRPHSPVAFPELLSRRLQRSVRRLNEGNTEGTPARARASACGHSFFSDSPGFLRFCGRRDPRLPSLPASELNGKEGVDGSSPSEGSAKAPHNGVFVSDQLAGSRTWGGYGALYGAFRSKTASSQAASLTEKRIHAVPNGLREAGVNRRRQVVSWNLVPWYIGSVDQIWTGHFAATVCGDSKICLNVAS